ncbi:MAG: M23 family metallopeptidase [Candidatus Staskawiczbacteria bacterium]|nr:M23 family metallopeptidase [Candidatus Staskawiczbacteria bacterium]
MLKIINKVLIRIKGAKIQGLLKNPLFFFGLISVILFSSLYISCGDLANTVNLKDNRVVFFNSFFNKSNSLNTDTLFSSQATAIPLETPDLKIMQDNTLCGVATPCVVSGKVLGDVFGGNNQNQKDVVNYTVQAGDTLQSIADAYKISVNTLLWANDLTTYSTIKVGQTLAVLPVDGVLHVVKSGDTVSGIAQTYKAQLQDVVSYNDLANQDDVYIGDILIIPGGVMPKKAGPVINNQIPLADNFFIFPVQGHISQGLHFYNAVDIANKCGTPVYAAAAGVVQRAVANGGWNAGMGNHITILHSNGTVTYYGHLMALMVKPGDKVYTGQNIALMGGARGMAGAGDSTGCHLHFEVVGARNPLSVYVKGATISYK